MRGGGLFDLRVQVRPVHVEQEAEQIALLRPGVRDQPVSVAESQPVRRMAGEPRRDAAAAVGRIDVERVDLAPAGEARQRAAARQIREEVGEPDQLITQVGAEAGAGHDRTAHLAAQRKPLPQKNQSPPRRSGRRSSSGPWAGPASSSPSSAWAS